MTYAVANLHGNNQGFQKLLQTIKFKDKDILYVLGDSVDFGEESMDLLTDMSMRVNVYPIAGEHDLKALRMLTGFEKMLKEGSAPTPEFSAEMTAWAAAVKDAAKALPFVVSVDSLEYNLDATDGKLSYTLTVTTDAGSVTVSQ